MDANYTGVFLDTIKTSFIDYDEIKEELDNSMDEYNNLLDLINYVQDDNKKIINYQDQDLVNKYLSLASIDLDKYQVIKYLISSSDSYISLLPQYIDSLSDLNTLVINIKNHRDDLSKKIDDLENQYYERWINKKYYNIFSSKKIYISDSIEFTNYLDKLDLSNDIKVNLLKDSIKYNYMFYQNEYYKDSNDYSKFILNHKIYLSNKYRSLIDNFDKYVDLSSDLSSLLEFSNKYDYLNLLFAKKIWIVNKINEEYLSDKMDDLDKLINEYNFIESLEDKSLEEIKRIMKEGH